MRQVMGQSTTPDQAVIGGRMFEHQHPHIFGRRERAAVCAGGTGRESHVDRAGPLAHGRQPVTGLLKSPSGQPTNNAPHH
jgi:hypothetical protein